MIPAKAAAILTLVSLGALAQARDRNFDPALPTKRRLRRRKIENKSERRILKHEKASREHSLAARDLQSRCILQGNLYGTFQGNYRNVEFRYQGVFSEGTSQTQINLNILPLLEREIVEGVLPAFFACPEVDPTGVINGISPSEADSLTVGGM